MCMMSTRDLILSGTPRNAVDCWNLAKTVCITEVRMLIGYFKSWISAEPHYLGWAVDLSTRCKFYKEAYSALMVGNCTSALVEGSATMFAVFQQGVHSLLVHSSSVAVSVGGNAVCYRVPSVTYISAHMVFHTFYKKQTLKKILYVMLIRDECITHIYWVLTA